MLYYILSMSKTLITILNYVNNLLIYLKIALHIFFYFNLRMTSLYLNLYLNLLQMIL